MPDAPRPRPRPPRSGGGFRPEFTLYVLYFFAFFLFFALLLAMPALLDALAQLPPAASIEAERAAGARIARRAVEGRLLWAFAAAVVTMAVGGYTKVLPGLRGHR
jgi:hypothetical protein